jgi:hypothetical protein
MNACTRRAFLSFAPGAVATAAIGIVGANFIEVAEALEVTEALPTAADPGQRGTASPLPLLTRAQWGPPHRSPGRPPPRRRRRWACHWHRGRRVCGWRRF